MSHRQSKHPAGHNLYGVYVNYIDGNYNFDTSPSLAGAREIAQDFKRERGVENVYAFYGNADGAFYHLDPVFSWRP